jgi:aminodeoxyfutalosine deaminase
MRKVTADLIFDGYHLLQNAVLLIDDTGTVEVVAKSNERGKTEHFPGLLMPGMINAHCHLELSHLKGSIPEKTGLVAFLQKVTASRNDRPPEKILAAARRAAKEMLENGIVAAGDICNGTDTIPIKQKGGLWYHTFAECIGFTDSGAEKRLEFSKNILKTFQTQTPFPASVVPHAPYSVSESLFRLINSMDSNHLLTIHNQESKAENEFYKTGTGSLLELYKQLTIDISFFIPSGKTSLPSYLPFFNKHQNLILVHNTFTGEADIIFANKQPLNIYWCLCPNANLYIENRLPDIELLRKNQCNIILGTDSLASNHQLSIVEEIKTIQQHFPAIPLNELLQWATINGAQALEAAQLFGSFEKGKHPGVTWISNMDIENCKLLPASKSQKIV